MIKIGITGGARRIAGELIRILVNHPDVTIQAIESRANAGLSVSSVHHGLVGELPMVFSPALDPSRLDALFVCDPESDITLPVLAHHYPELKIIDLTWQHSLHPDEEDTIYGLSEIYRKPLVRGALTAVVPQPLASIALIALYPMAAHQLLVSPIEIIVEAPDDLCTPEILEKSTNEVFQRLQELQPEFDFPVTITATPTGHHRATRIRMTLPCTLTTEEVQRLFDSIYDDHNFTFLVSEPADTREVSGTHKCIISLRKPTPGFIEIDALADCRMRGGAGEAVHAFNLLFGLHEKVGLTFKAAKY